MTTVKIAELKSRLSAYLRRVRRGQTITVLDRETPIARLEPVTGSASRLVVREPGPGARRPGDVRLPPPLRLSRDVLEMLGEERGEP
jgi:prevent-host-death family protein